MPLPMQPDRVKVGAGDKTVLEGPGPLDPSHLPLQMGLEGVAVAEAPDVILLWILLLTHSVSASFDMLGGKGFSF